MKRTIYFFLIVVSLLSCKKDKLTGDKEIFIGTWEWEYSEQVIFYNINSSAIITIDSTFDGKSHTITFFENGKVAFYTKGELVETHRVVFAYFGKPCDITGTSVDFGIYLDNEKEDKTFRLNGCVSEDALQIHKGFPYSGDEENEKYYSSYFKRKK